MTKTALAFMSYVNLDDKHENGNLTNLREYLSREVRMQTGEQFDIFQDKKDIKWGQQWQERINKSLNSTTFLIPIITPSFFNSAPCRAEMESFLEREEELCRNDLILPVYYCNCAVLEDEARREHDPLAQIIAARQYMDWRHLRFKPFDSEQVRTTLANEVQQIVVALERRQEEVPRAEAVKQAGTLKEATDSAQQKKNNKETGSSNTTFKNDGGTQSNAVGDNPIGTQYNYYVPPPAPPDKPELEQVVNKTGVAVVLIGVAFFLGGSYLMLPVKPITMMVDQQGKGNYATISDALTAAQAGSQIFVQPGMYKEGIVIDKPVEIIGVGERNDIVIEATGKDAVLFKADKGRVANLTLRQTGSDKWYGVNVTQGRLELVDCDISSQGSACVAIHGSADPILRRNRIHDGKSAGVLVYDNGKGTLEDNEIFANKFAGVAISEGGNPTLRRNRIRDGKESGIFIYSNGQGLLEDNEIFANAKAGVSICGDGDPTLRRNRITQNGYEGIGVRYGGGGTFEGNDLQENTEGAWSIGLGCAARVRSVGNKE